MTAQALQGYSLTIIGLKNKETLQQAEQKAA
jgi:hypothetical protein